MTAATPVSIVEADPASPRRGIAHKLAEVMGEIESIEKKGRMVIGNTERYRFVQAADLYEMVREKLASRHVAFIASAVGIESQRETKTSGGGTMYTTTVRVRLTFHDAETDETIEAEWLGSGQDTADKDISKAFTGAVKSFLLTTFLVPSDTDPDDGGDAGRSKRAASGKLPKKDADTLAKVLKGYTDAGGDLVAVRLRLTQLGARDVSDATAAAVKLSKDKAAQLFEWLDGELVELQKAKP